MKKLTRSKNNRILAGVCGGFSNYFGVDPSLLRVILAIAVLAGHGFLIFLIMYLICWFIIPPEL